MTSAQVKCGTDTYCQGYLKLANRENTSVGLGQLHLMDIKTGKESSLPTYRYGRKKSESIVINFCPVCGGSFEDRIKGKNTKESIIS